MIVVDHYLRHHVQDFVELAYQVVASHLESLGTVRDGLHIGVALVMVECAYTVEIFAMDALLFVDSWQSGVTPFFGS
jgi:hypothetical protein